MRAQLDLAKKIAESEYAEEFYVCTSVGVLCISGGSDFLSSLNYPSISIQYLGNQTFKVTYSGKPLDSNSLEKHKCHSSQVFSLLESLFLRLKLESEEIQKAQQSQNLN